MRKQRTLVLVSLLIFLSARAYGQETEKPLPEYSGFVAEVKARLQINQTALKHYTYQQRNAQKHLDKNGRVKKVETRVYEVFPDNKADLTYRRLVEKDGKPVPESELKKQDRDYEKKRAKKEKKYLKAGAEAEEKAKKEEREAIEEAFRVFEIAMEGRDVVHGRPAIRFSFKPRPGIKPKSDEVKILQNFSGQAWFDETLYEMVRLEVEAIRDVRIGFGLLAKLSKGSKGSVERRFFNDEVWLPSSTRFTGNLRLLLVKSMRMDVTDEFFDYRRFSVETSVSFDRE